MAKLITIQSPNIPTRFQLARAMGTHREVIRVIEQLLCAYCPDYYDSKIPYCCLSQYQIWAIKKAFLEHKRSDRKLDRQRLQATLKRNPGTFSLESFQIKPNLIAS